MTRSLEAAQQELWAAMDGIEPGVAAANELCLASVGLCGVDGAAVSMIHEGASQGTFGSSGPRSRRLDEYQFTFGEGPCLDAVATQAAVLVADLDAAHEYRWPAFAGAVLEDGIRGVFALPITIASVCVGALDLFRATPGPMGHDQLAVGLLAAQLASGTLLDLVDIDESASRPEQEGDDRGWARLSEIDRIEVYQATGMLIAQLDLSSADALVRLRAHAVATGQTASEVALAIIERRLVLDRDHSSGT